MKTKQAVTQKQNAKRCELISTPKAGVDLAALRVFVSLLALMLAWSFKEGLI